MAARPRIFLLPGMGADDRLLEPQRSIDGEVIVPPWIAPTSGESIESYSRRMAQSIDSSQPFYLGGVSFGGIIAQEMARHVPARGVILIATCRRLRQIPRIYRIMAWLSAGAPALHEAIQISAKARFMFGIQTAEQGQLFDTMLAGADVNFLRWILRAMAMWLGPVRLEMPRIHIHGSQDRVIPRWKVHPTHLIDGAGHVVNVTHAEQVNALIERWIKYCDASVAIR